jgi:hypothetical protein
MAGSSGRTELISQLQELLKQHSESFTNASFLGWTPDSKSVHEKRADLIRVLCRQLAALDDAI